MSLDIQLSDEQQAVVNAIATHNVMVDSVAGCGKTSTSLGICVKYSDKNVLIVTYNTKLRKETLERVRRLNITNVEIHTYHSLCTKYYKLSPTDVVMNKVCTDNMPPFRDVPLFDILILDESQDVDHLCFTFITKFMHDNCKQPHIAVFGDINQSIYGFKGSDYRYLTEAKHIYKEVSNREWCSLNIHESFRVTQPVANFVNQQLLGNNRIVSNKVGNKVRYIYYDAFSRKGIITQIGQIIRGNNWKSNEIFILSYSVRSTNKHSPVKILENQLVKEGFPCYVPIDDDAELDENVMRDKITFSSFHQAKGRERKIVFLIGFDERSYQFYVEEKKSPISSIINTFYVGLTRAMENLIILHHYKNGMFPTVNINLIGESCDITSDKKYSYDEDAVRRGTTPKRGVRDVLRFLTLDMSMDLMSHLVIEKTQLKKKVTDVKPYAAGQTLQNKQQYESISDLYGNAITIYNEILHTCDLPIGVKRLPNKHDFKLEDVLPFMRFDPTEQVIEQDRQRTTITTYKYNPDRQFNCQKLMLLCNFIDSWRSGYLFRWRQLTDYSFVDDAAINLSSEIIDEIIPRERVYEHILKAKVHPLLELTGFIDILTDTTIYEIKFTSETKPEHLFQIAIYGYLMDDTTTESKAKPKHKLILINVREGIQYEIVEFNQREAFMRKIVEFNNRPELQSSMEQFMLRVTSTASKITKAKQGEKLVFENYNPIDLEPPVVVIPVDNSDLLARLAKLKPAKK